MNSENGVFDLFSDSTQKMIAAIDKNELSSLEDLIKIQEAADRSHKMHAVLGLWSNQKSEERKLRKLYALCFVIILALQIIIMNVIFLLVGCDVIIFTEVQFNVFYISMFGEITALVLIVTKYLFHKAGDSELIDTIKDL